MRAFLKALGTAVAIAILSIQTAVAGWFTAHGSAPIIDGDIASARRSAIDDALRNASLQAGADISIEQVLEHGTLLDDKMHVKSHSPIRSLKVIEEQENGKMVTVLVKALIDIDGVMDCYAGNIRKNILPFVFQYEDAEASCSAVGLENFDIYLSNTLYSGIAQSPAITVMPPDKSRLLVHQTASGPNYNLQKTLDALSRHSQAQFIIVGTINSLAISETGENAFTRMFYTPTRTLRFSVGIYDVYSGHMILKKDYSGEAEWTFERGKPVSIRSDKFNTSEYGQRAHQLIHYALSDIVTTLRCQIPQARVIQVTDNNIRINLGSNANIQEGMEFKIIHRTDYHDRHNKTYFQNNRTVALYKVIDVSPTTATLAPSNANNQLINVMLDDIVSLRQ